LLRGPLNVASNGWFSNEFLTVYGVAADGVSRVTIFLADGQRLNASMRDNLFAAVVPTRLYPISVVGYDARNRVVGIETGLNFIHGADVPAKARRLRRVRTVTGPNGGTATLELGTPAGGVQCWRLRAAAISRDRCMPLFRTGPAIEAHLVQPVGRDVFLFGWVSTAISRVDLELPLHNRIASVQPVSGHYLLAVPRKHVGRERRHAYLVGFDRAGHRVQRIGVFYRLR
jgi:hypothetical protein